MDGLSQARHAATLAVPAGTWLRDEEAVRGRPALALPERISWSQDGQTIVVARPDPVLPANELINVADSLR